MKRILQDTRRCIAVSHNNLSDVPRKIGEIWGVLETYQKQHLFSQTSAAVVAHCHFNAGRDCGAASVAVVTNEFLMPPRFKF